MDEFADLWEWVRGLGIDPRELRNAIGFTGEPGMDPRGALNTVVRVCESSADDEGRLSLIAVRFVDPLIDLNWRELRGELVAASMRSEAFRKACSFTSLDDQVPDDLVAELGAD